jgi:outer membrane translocation and assembly module TamA
MRILSVLVVVATLVVAAPAGAQTPRSERPYRGLFAGDTGNAQQLLTLSASLGGGYDDNIFANGSDLGFNLRHAVGVGLRWDSPVGLLRGDVGFPLNRKPGERSYQVWFGLGQAF